jgi:flagellar basal-body rod modification protein FlgD
MSTISSNYSSSSSTSSTSTTTDAYESLDVSDFVTLMMTQLQNQDPLDPTSNAELMAQISQIGQMQNNSTMKDLLTNLSLQNQIGSAGGLIGKSVTGIQDKQNVSGTVSSVSIADSKVSLVLDDGTNLAMENVTAIAPADSGT